MGISWKNKVNTIAADAQIINSHALIARFMGLTWDPPGADRTHVGPMNLAISLQWRHNGRDGISNYQPHDCLLNRLFRRRQRKHQSSTSLAFVWGIHRWLVNSLHKWSVMRKMSPFDDVIMWVVLARLSMKKDVNTLRPRKNVWQFADNILKCHYLNENAWNSIIILLKFVPRVQSTILQHWLRSWLGTH